MVTNQRMYLLYSTGGSEAVLPDDDDDFLEDGEGSVPFDVSMPTISTLGGVEEGIPGEAHAPDGSHAETVITGDDILNVEVPPAFGGSSVPRDRDEVHPVPVEQVGAGSGDGGQASSSSRAPAIGSAPAGAPCPVDPRVDLDTGALPN